ncbi:YiiX/YebB-like N1pC/P60 family cysteine hydrolase [Priestia aryabhattai]|uniref:YiiX/YebB-like N1pC/P60 family cysteine hydrolase n=1 Tax=Priestia megaterium TaxID=1404 RepID=UPI003F977650
MRRGDIVFVQGKGIISSFVRYFDRGTFSHCAIAVSDSRVIEANYDTKVAVRPLEKDKCNVIEVIDLGLKPEQRRNIYNASMKYVGKRYDYTQILWYVLRKVFHLKGRNRFNNPNHMICSELVFLVLDEIGALKDLEIKESIDRGIDLTPNELYDLVKYVSTK